MRSSGRSISPGVGAPNTLGSRKDPFGSDVGVGAGRDVEGLNSDVGVSGGEDDQPALMLLGERGSIVRSW